MGDQMAAALLNLRLASDLSAARELEAFQAMSTFFVHDLKNAASTLNLMLKNLPVHFDDPEFRKDALRGIGSTVERINQLIARLGTLRGQLELKRAPVEWNALVNEALAGVRLSQDITLETRLGDVPPVPADREKLLSVFTNLVVNATEAFNGAGKIGVSTRTEDRHAVLVVADNGCGMTAEFVRGGLFRPFRTTKKKGLGIGMFQSRMIVEAHKGRMEVQSAPGAGTTIEVWLPIEV
jgi:putative PEP-CTERM system histidine kinase